MSMFGDFTREESIASQTQVKASVQKGVRSSILENLGDDDDAEEVLEIVMPKKGAVFEMVKCHGYVSLAAVDRQYLFFTNRDGPWLPSLKMLHRFPNLLPHIRMDKGAVRHILGGAPLMCPGLTGAGGGLPDEDLPKDTHVAVMAEGHQHAMAVGRILMSTDEMKKVNKGKAVEILHIIGDGLWKLE